MAALDNTILRTIWFMYKYLALATVQIPYFILKSLLPWSRGHRQWSAMESVMNDITKEGLRILVTPRPEPPQWVAQISSKNSPRIASFPVSKPEHYIDVLVSRSNVKPGPVKGLWYPNAAAATATHDPVVLHVHGGAFVIGEPNLHSAYVGRTITREGLAPRVLALGYRLASARDGSGEFPAPVQDVLTAYIGLLNAGNDPSKIYISGDSAGGNACFALLRYLSRFGKELGIPLPAAVLLWSPWGDLSRHWDNAHAVAEHPRESSDFLCDEFTDWGARAYCPSKEIALNEYATGIGHPFATPVPLFIHVGEVEILYNDAATIAKEMQSIAGNVVSFQVSAKSSHDPLLMAYLTQMTTPAEEGVQWAKAFVGTNRVKL